MGDDINESGYQRTRAVVGTKSPHQTKIFKDRDQDLAFES